MSFLTTIRPLTARQTHTYSTIFTRRCLFSTTPISRRTPPYVNQPGPPKLPKEEQEIFDQLQKSSTGAFSTMKSDAPPQVAVDEPEDLLNEHPNLRRGEQPLFEGERNPKTGEVGGPKTDPLKYGDYAYNGRVTDF